MRAFMILSAAAASLVFGQSPATDGRVLDGIAHVAFRVSNLAASREFYQKLGFEQAFEFTDERGVTTSYMKVNDRQFIELYRRDNESQALGLMHICFDASDLARVRAAYVERGLKPAEIAKARAGNLLFSMRDPEGQLLEYTQYLPGSLHSNERGKHLGERRISGRLQGASTSVKDLAAERKFYADTLGFADGGSPAGARLRVPGSTGEDVELEAITPDWRPRIDFAVADAKQAANELQQRGLTVRMSGSAAVARDPDGVSLVFIGPAGR